MLGPLTAFVFENLPRNTREQFQREAAEQLLESWCKALVGSPLEQAFQVQREEQGGLLLTFEGDVQVRLFASASGIVCRGAENVRLSTCDRLYFDAVSGAWKALVGVDLEPLEVISTIAAEGLQRVRDARLV